MCNTQTVAEKSVTQDEAARIHYAHVLSEYLFSLSMMCKDFDWHRTGMHLCAASDELKVMLHKHDIKQRRYTLDGRHG